MTSMSLSSQPNALIERQPGSSSASAQPRPSSAASIAVDILSAEKIYPNGMRALQPVDLKIKEGDFVTLLGPSGCGKSTLLKMIAGLTPTSDGRIKLWNEAVEKFGGRNVVDGLNRARKLSYVFQEATLMPWHNVQRNVRLPLELAGVPKREADDRVAEALKLVGLDRFSRSLPRELSGGMQMRASIARGLVTVPDLLLMDEPFGALDEITRNKLDSDLLALWAKRGLTVMFVTHSIHEAVFLSNRVIVMTSHPGRVVADIRIDEPFPRDPSFRLSTRFSEQAMQLQELLHNASTSTAEGM